MEQFANEASAVLSGDIDGAVTSITVATDVNIPSGGTFRARIESEYLKVTAVSGSTWTVVRGDGGTTAAPHVNGTTIYVVVTKEAIDSLVSVQQDGTEVASRRILNFTGMAVSDDSANDRVDIAGVAGSTGTSAAEPAASANPSQLYLPTDGARVDFSTGTAWSSFGPIFPIVRPPLASTWTTVNFGTGDSLSDTGPGLGAIVTRHSSDWFRLAVQTLGSPPYTATAVMLSIYPLASAARINLCLRDSVSGKLIVFGPLYNTQDRQLFVTEMNSATSFNAHKLQTTFGMYAPMLFLRVHDDGTNRNYMIGVDGVTYSTVYTEATGTWITPNQVGWGVDVPSGGPFASTLIHWEVTS